MQIKNEFKIEGLQNFEQYSKVNPISIRIIDPDIQTKLLFYSKKYKYRFFANSLLFSSSIEEDTKAIFITSNGLNDAKDLLISGKVFQGIGVIYISEIENWDKNKKRIILDYHNFNWFNISDCSKTFCFWIWNNRLA